MTNGLEIVFRDKSISAKDVEKVLGKGYKAVNGKRKGVVDLYALTFNLDYDDDYEFVREELEDSLHAEILEINKTQERG